MSITTPQDHFYQINKPQKMNKKNIAYVVLGLVVIILISYLIWGKNIALAPSEKINLNTTEQTSDNLKTTNSADITVANQIPGEVVLIGEIEMAESGWVAIHDDLTVKPSKILGAYYLPAGSYKNQIVPLLRGISDGSSYIAVIHTDNGDRIFDYKLDTPVLNTEGEMEVARFSVIAESPRGE